jgi:hypothetical protein
MPKIFIIIYFTAELSVNILENKTNIGALGLQFIAKRRGIILYLIIGKNFIPINRNWNKIFANYSSQS